ncbi:MAG: bifunctional diguanylate cyclase/phosphodiesterase [Treponema sp.]|nr:bifunctional diguanylate cyclase/phosphodiesterase [Treponema sp.]MDY5837919.1 bifunctional diguanylate cyclase/phosphodiesterase [Treponema sp.]
MEFNFKEYSQLFEQFLLKLEKLPSHTKSDITEAISDIADFFHIGKIELSTSDSFEEMEQGNFYTQTIFGSSHISASGFFPKQEVSSNGKVYNFVVYQLESRKWTKFEEEKISLIIKMLFTFIEKASSENRVTFLTYHEGDFGLYNLNYFKDFVRSKISSKEIVKYGICLFQIKNIPSIYQQFGKDIADTIIKNFILDLNDILEESEILCRITGENFLICFNKNRINQIKNYLEKREITFNLETKEKIILNTIAGYYMTTNNTVQASVLLDYATTALDTAKNLSHESYAFFDDTLTQKALHAKNIENMFPQALKNEEFLIYYQPKVRLTDYRLVGAEALCRWNHNGNLIPPDSFIPHLEQTKIICSLDFYMLDHVCQDISKWIKEGKEVVKVSVNLSRCHLNEANLLERIIKIIDKHNVPHHYIEIELTETTTEVDYDVLKNLLTGLQLEGISTSVDDFGVGYSSLNLITQFPWNVLKIDKSFLPNVVDGNSNRNAMIKHIISIAKNFGIDCIVEGVETIEHIKLLKENKCFLAQGYYFDPPLKREAFEERLMALLS